MRSSLKHIFSHIFSGVPFLQNVIQDTFLLQKTFSSLLNRICRLYYCAFSTHRLALILFFIMDILTTFHEWAYHQIEFKLSEEAGRGISIKNTYTLSNPSHPLETMQSLDNTD